MRAQGGRAKVDAEAGAPDADGSVLVQISVGRHFVVLIALVAFDRAKINEAGLRDTCIVLGHFRGYQIDMDIRTIGSLKIAEPQYALAVGKLMNRGCPGGLVRETAE